MDPGRACKTEPEYPHFYSEQLVFLMMRVTQGNLLEAPVEALVNTVNTVEIMGKGIALMFKEAFPLNFRDYEHACKSHEIVVGKMFGETRGQHTYCSNFG
jgi:hypothetical protein